jgi:hypothetical protein
VLSTEEGSGWQTTHHRMSCREGNISRAGELPHSHEDQLKPMGTTDEDKIGGTWPVGGMALDAICSVVPPEMVTTLTTKDTTNGGVGEHQDDVD